MKIEKSNQQVVGVASAAGAYALWGIMPIYWKLVNSVPSLEILAHRIVWSLVFLFFVLLAAGKLRSFSAELKAVLANPRQRLCLASASIIVSVNWLTFIWAVTHEHIIETSLGYYINPLISVFLGIAVLKEKLSFWQTVSFFLAAIGVLNLTLHFGAFPWVALILAVSFGLYGLLKKVLNFGALSGIAAETLIIFPLPLVYLAYLNRTGHGAFAAGPPAVTLLLAGAGIVTAVPLILFASGAIRLPLSTVGFLQYISPTISLVLGVFLYHEPFTAVHLVSFVLIWAALTIFSLSRTRSLLQLESSVQKKLALKGR